MTRRARAIGATLIGASLCGACGAENPIHPTPAPICHVTIVPAQTTILCEGGICVPIVLEPERAITVCD